MATRPLLDAPRPPPRLERPPQVSRPRRRLLTFGVAAVSSYSAAARRRPERSEWRRDWIYEREAPMTISSNAELAGIRRAGIVVKSALDVMKKAVRPGMTTQELDDLCADVFERHGARSGPQLVYGFPGSACISINEEAVHGIPQATRTINEGDLVKLDVTAELDGYFADAAVTVNVGTTSSRRLRLARCARSALHLALGTARAGRPMNGIGIVVQTEVERQGFSVMPKLGGHGVGRTVHEKPFVRNFYAPWDRQRLWAGLVIAIEPVISSGSGASVTAADGWTVKTADGSPSAHFEHTVVITDGNPIVATS